MSAQIVEKFSNLMADQNTAVAKDLKLNFKRIFEDSALSAEEATLTALAVAKTLGFSKLLELLEGSAKDAGLADEVIREAEENAAIMGMLNIYYRFRHFVDKEVEGEGYGGAKLRMQALANPAMGKEKYEMLSFAVSAVNGCEKCVTSHEKALLHLGVSRDKIHDLARLSAIITGLHRLDL